MLPEDIQHTAGGHPIHFADNADTIRQCPAFYNKPCIMGNSDPVNESVKDDPFWGPILFPNGELDVKELAAHLTDYERLLDGASYIVDNFTLGMSGGYKSYTKQAVRSQIEDDYNHNLTNDLLDLFNDICKRAIAGQLDVDNIRDAFLETGYITESQLDATDS